MEQRTTQIPMRDLFFAARGERIDQNRVKVRVNDATYVLTKSKDRTFSVETESGIPIRQVFGSAIERGVLSRVALDWMGSPSSSPFSASM